MARSRKRKDILQDALKWILKSSATGSDKVEWPEMAEGTDDWYGKGSSGLRQSTAAGYMREAEREVPGAPHYGLRFDMPDEATGKPADRAFSSSAGLVNIPLFNDEGDGYFSKPQYLESVIDHEVAHNVDWAKNRPAIGHNKETFRPLEKAASRASQLEPGYNPGDDVGINGANEYPDRYKKLADYVMKYYIGLNPQDLTRSVKPIEPKYAVKELARQRQNFARSGGTVRKPMSGGSVAALN